MIVTNLTSKEKLPTTFGYAVLKIETGSMSPTLNPNDVVIIKKCDKEDYEENQIVAFWMNSYDYIPTVHRIVEINENEVITKGDYAGNSNDPVKELDDLVGKEVLTLPKFGYVIDFIRSPIGVVSILLVIFIIAFVPSIINSIKNKDENKEKEVN
jgi:signal peptidase